MIIVDPFTHIFFELISKSLFAIMVGYVCMNYDMYEKDEYKAGLLFVYGVLQVCHVGYSLKAVPITTIQPSFCFVTFHLTLALNNFFVDARLLMRAC